MNNMNRHSVLTAGSIAMFLLLGTSVSLAEEVCLDGDTVMGIKNLEVVTDQYGTVNIDVDFRYETGYTVYGSDLSNFPFTNQNLEEDAFATMAQINEVLTTNNPVPGSAGQPGQDTYYIGVESETELGETVIAAVGSENVGGFWDPCAGENCLAGTAVLEADQRFTYADLNGASGGRCDNVPPPPDDPPPTSFNIVPCITGSWFLLARDGEGYNIEILETGLDPAQMLAFHYTYDDEGNQVYLIGQGFVDGDTAVLPTQITSGPVYGDDYDPTDVVREDWGTLTFTFTSKDTGTVLRESTMAGFGTTEVDIERLSYVEGLACP